MHLLIPFACSNAPGCAEALRGLRLPNLDALLQRLVHVDTDEAALTSLSPPHERALARLYGMQAADGCLAWAALEAQQTGRSQTDAAWAWVSPVHWNVGAHHIEMTDPAMLALDPVQSRALLASMAPYFAEDGITLDQAAPDRWLARGAVFHGLASAALDRVVGRDIQLLMPSVPALRRLQNEMQMLLYTHPVNDLREARGQPSVNSFWISGTGVLPASARTDATGNVLVGRSLRDAAIHGDWGAWAAAWVELDRGACKRLLEALASAPHSRLTLCGERSAIEFGLVRQPLWRRLQRRWSPTNLPALQDSL